MYIECVKTYWTDSMRVVVVRGVGNGTRSYNSEVKGRRTLQFVACLTCSLKPTKPLRAKDGAFLYELPSDAGTMFKFALTYTFRSTRGYACMANEIRQTFQRVFFLCHII